MSATSIHRWRDGRLELLDWCDMTGARVVVADSWLSLDGRTLALPAHRERFVAGVPADIRSTLDVEGFWSASLEAIPRSGAWFPRVELQDRGGAPLLALRVREAPERHSTVRVATHPGDPRREPAVKGPDLERLGAARALAARRGAGEAIIVSPDGFVVEGAYSSLVWWAGDELCVVDSSLPRVASVTERSLRAAAGALGVPVHELLATPDDLDGREVWALSALHGPRLVTEWIDGPAVAARPKRLELWRSRLAALARESTAASQ